MPRHRGAFGGSLAAEVVRYDALDAVRECEGPRVRNEASLHVSEEWPISVCEMGCVCDGGGWEGLRKASACDRVAAVERWVFR